MSALSLSRSTATALLRKSVCSQCTRTLAARSFTHVPFSARRPVQPVIRLPITAIRKHSVPPSSSKIYDFNQIKAMSDSPSNDRIIIDVREPAEYEQGFIPSAVNLPVKSSPDGLFLPEEEFEDRFGFEKPGKDQEVVFYCRSGVRSNAAAQLAQQSGYTNVSEYRGSWLDWEKNGGPGSKA